MPILGDADQKNCSSGNENDLWCLCRIVRQIFWNSSPIWNFNKSDFCNNDIQLVRERLIVGKSARDNPERYCGWFSVHCFTNKFQRMAREAMDVCLRVLKESNKSRFDSYSVRNRVLIISHITFRDCRVHSFYDNLSRNSYIFLITDNYFFELWNENIGSKSSFSFLNITMISGK